MNKKLQERLINSLKNSGKRMPMKATSPENDFLYSAFENNYSALAGYHLLKETDIPLLLVGGGIDSNIKYINLIQSLSSGLCYVVGASKITSKLIGGNSINSTFHLPPEQFKPDAKILNSFSTDAMFELLNADFILIDQISMVSSAKLDCIDKICQSVCGLDEPFGGLKVMLLGDLFQLPPILSDDERKYIKENYKSEFFFDSNVYQRMYPIEIQINAFQNQHYLEILESLKSTENRLKSINILNANCLKNKVESNTVIITNSNKDAESINQQKLENNPGALHSYKAIISGDYNLKKSIWEAELFLKEGVRVIFLEAHSGGEYKFGTLATIEKLSSDSIRLFTDEGKKVELVRSVSKNYNKFKKSGTKVCTTIELLESGKIQQFPIKLAFALTVYSTQGLSFDSVHIMNKVNKYSSNFTYSAMSRCKSLEGLSFQNTVKAQDFNFHKRVLGFNQKVIKSSQDLEPIMDILIEYVTQNSEESLTEHPHL